MGLVNKQPHFSPAVAKTPPKQITRQAAKNLIQKAATTIIQSVAESKAEEFFSTKGYHWFHEVHKVQGASQYVKALARNRAAILSKSVELRDWTEKDWAVLKTTSKERMVDQIAQLLTVKYADIALERPASFATKEIDKKRYPSDATIAHNIALHFARARRLKAFGDSGKSDIISAAYWFIVSTNAFVLHQIWEPGLNTNVEEWSDKELFQTSLLFSIFNLSSALQCLSETTVE